MRPACSGPSTVDEASMKRRPCLARSRLASAPWSTPPLPLECLLQVLGASPKTVASRTFRELSNVRSETARAVAVARRALAQDRQPGAGGPEPQTEDVEGRGAM